MLLAGTFVYVSVVGLTRQAERWGLARVAAAAFGNAVGFAALHRSTEGRTAKLWAATPNRPGPAPPIYMLHVTRWRGHVLIIIGVVWIRILPHTSWRTPNG